MEEGAEGLHLVRVSGKLPKDKAHGQSLRMREHYRAKRFEFYSSVTLGKLLVPSGFSTMTPKSPDGLKANADFLNQVPGSWLSVLGLWAGWNRL